MFYMVLHAGWFHLGFNLSIQLLIGLPLEMVHGSTRIACVYLAGVLAGSLGTSVFDPDVYLVGASGGVYALLAAHLANVMLNYNQMKYGIIRLAGILIFGKCLRVRYDDGSTERAYDANSFWFRFVSFPPAASCDVGFAIYFRYAEDSLNGTSVSYVAHLTGALAGLTIGLLVLKNFEQKLHEQLIWWVALGVYAACTVFAIVYNIMNTEAAQRFEESEEVMRQQLFHDLGI